MNREQAEKIVEQKVLTKYPECAILKDATREFDTCFAVFYQSEIYIETGKVDDMLIGQGPVLVDKNTKRIYETGSAYTTEHYVRALEECGDPFGIPTENVLIEGLRDEAEITAIIGILKEYTRSNSRELKLLLDQVRNGHVVKLACGNASEAEKMVRGLQETGLIARQLWNARH